MWQQTCGERVQQLLHAHVIGLHGGLVCYLLETALILFLLPIAQASDQQRMFMTINFNSHGILFPADT